MCPLLNPGIVVLSSPILLDTFSVMRRIETVNSSGESVLSVSATTGIYGVVKAIGDRLDRRTDEETSKKDLRVFTKFALRGSTRDGVVTNYKPDLVYWHGNNFIVVDVRDWGAYGVGYVVAECNLFELVSAPPQVNSGLGNSGTLLPFGGLVTAYQPTIISSTQATIPITVLQQNCILFKNSLQLQAPSQFTISGNTITFVDALVPGDSLTFYA